MDNRLRYVPWIGAVFVGGCMFLSSALVPVQLGAVYQGIVPLYYADGNNYRARIQEVLDGRPMAVSAYLHEYKQEPFNIAPVGEWLYAIPALLIGISAVQWAYFFLLPAALFLLVYFFTRKLLGEETIDAELTALAAGLLVLFGFEFVDYHYVFSLVSGGDPAAFVWTRPVNPILGAIQLFGLLLLLWKMADARDWKLIVGIGVLVASMIGYFFAWGMSLAILGGLFVISVARKNYILSRDLFYAGVISVGAVSPYLYGALLTLSGDEGVRASMRTGMFYTHEFVVNNVLSLASVAITILFIGATRYMPQTILGNAKSWTFIFALLIAGWVAFNEQVVTGRQIWHHHFVQYTVPFVYVTLLSAGYISIRVFVPRTWRVVIIGAIVVMSAHGIYTATTVHKVPLEVFRKEQEFSQLIIWLKQNTVDECVILSPDNKTGQFINAYTQCDVYVSGEALYAVPAERVLHNYLLLVRLKGISTADARSYFFEREREVRGYMFDDWHQLFGNGKDEWFVSKAEYLVSAYEEFTQVSLKERLHEYRVDYLVWREGEILPEVLNELGVSDTPQKVGEFYLYEFK